MPNPVTQVQIELREGSKGTDPKSLFRTGNASNKNGTSVRLLTSVDFLFACCVGCKGEPPKRHPHFFICHFWGWGFLFICHILGRGFLWTFEMSEKNKIHFAPRNETLGEAVVSWYLQGNRIIRGFLNGARSRPSTVWDMKPEPRPIGKGANCLSGRPMAPNTKSHSSVLLGQFLNFQTRPPAQSRKDVQ